MKNIENMTLLEIKQYALTLHYLEFNIITLEDVDVENVIFYRGISDSNELHVSTNFNSYCLKPNTIYECDGIYYGIFENKESALNLIRQYRKTKNELKIKELQHQIDKLQQENNNI
jgi:hypothetical protein